MILRTKTIPAIWPVDSTVFVEFSNGVTKQYDTDHKAVPSYIKSYIRSSNSTISKVEEFISDGTGIVTTTVAYTTQSLRVYIDGSLTAPSRITELTTTTYSITNAPDTGSLIITQYTP